MHVHGDTIYFRYAEFNYCIYPKYSIAPDYLGIQIKVLLFFLENIYCGFSLEAPRRGEIRKISKLFGLKKYYVWSYVFRQFLTIHVLVLKFMSIFTCLCIEKLLDEW